MSCENGELILHLIVSSLPPVRSNSVSSTLRLPLVACSNTRVPGIVADAHRGAV